MTVFFFFTVSHKGSISDRSKGMPVAVFVLFNNNFIKNPTKGRKFPVAQVAGKVEGCYNIIDFL